MRDFDSAIKLSPGTTKYYANKAELLFVLEEDEAALAAADKAIKLDPKCELAWYAKAKAQGRLKRPEEALKSINVVLSLSPKDALTLETRARLYVVQNRWQEAEKDLDQALNLSAGLISAYNDRINVCQHLKQWSKVVSDCTACLKIQTDHPGRMLQSRARAYAALHDYAKAVDDLKQAVKIWPDDIKVHRELEAVYKAMGDQKGQAMEAEKIKSLNRDY